MAERSQGQRWLTTCGNAGGHYKTVTSGHLCNPSKHLNVTAQQPFTLCLTTHLSAAIAISDSVLWKPVDIQVFDNF